MWAWACKGYGFDVGVGLRVCLGVYRGWMWAWACREYRYGRVVDVGCGFVGVVAVYGRVGVVVWACRFF